MMKNLERSGDGGRLKKNWFRLHVFLSTPSLSLSLSVSRLLALGRPLKAQVHTPKWALQSCKQLLGVSGMQLISWLKSFLHWKYHTSFFRKECVRACNFERAELKLNGLWRRHARCTELRV